MTLMCSECGSELSELEAKWIRYAIGVKEVPLPFCDTFYKAEVRLLKEIRELDTE